MRIIRMDMGGNIISDYDPAMKDDIPHWLQRWRECYPNTYPPELWSASGCLRCGQPCLTFHQCPDLIRAPRD